MMKTISAVIALSFMLSGCHNNGDEANPEEIKKDTTYAIIGKVTGLDSGMIVINHRQTDKADTAILDHGFFKFSGIADTAELCTISMNNQVKRFFLENGKISMLMFKDSLPSAQITGTKTQDEFNTFSNIIIKPLADQIKQIDKAYDLATSKNNRKAMDSLDAAYNVLDQKQQDLISEYTKTHPSSIVSAYEISNHFSYNPRVSQLDSLFQLLDNGVRQTYFGRKIENILTKEKLTAIGKPAPDFSLNDADGNPVTLASFKGSYVLVDFWASWCGPCRQENPNVVKAFHRFKGKGFDIFGVSLDEDKSDWVKAVKKDRLDWTHVSDLKGWKSSVVSLYGIQGIPMNYLLDKNGIIIAKGLRGKDLEVKLNSILQ